MLLWSTLTRRLDSDLASIEHLLISKLIEEQDLTELVTSGVKASHFSGDWADIYKWILAHNSKHGAVPSERQFSNAYGDVDIEDTTTETFSGLTEELFAAYRKRMVTGAMSDAMGALDNGKTEDAMGILTKGIGEAQAETNTLRDFNIIETWEARLAKYDEMRKTPNALRGIPTGFYGLDKITHGLRPQQWIVIGGEQKRGKSVIMLVMADACQVHGLRAGLISQEMSVDEQTSRYDAYKAGIDYNNILSGNLSDQEMERLEYVMRRNKNSEAFIMSEDASGLTTISAVRAKAIEHKMDALYVDGVYLMDDENGEPKGSPQALTNISRGFKRMAQDLRIPVIGTTQALGWKLGNKRTRALTTDALGYTSAFGQDADLILGVERNPDIDNQSIVRVLDARTAPRAEFHIQFDWSTMSFEEVDFDGPIDPAFL